MFLHLPFTCFALTGALASFRFGPRTFLVLLPGGLLSFVDLLLPDGHAGFELVYAVGDSFEGVYSLGAAHRNDDGRFFDRYAAQPADKRKR